MHAVRAAGHCKSLSLRWGSPTHRRALCFRVDARVSHSPASSSVALLADKPPENDTASGSEAGHTFRGPSQQLTKPQRPSQPAHQPQQADMVNNKRKGGQKSSKRITPMLMADYIKAQWLAASNNMATANPNRTVTLYIKRMDELCLTNQTVLDYMHISAILYGTGRILSTAAAVHRNWLPQPSVELKLQAFLSRMLAMLQQVMPAVGSRQASTIFLAFAKMRINPDDVIPGIVDELAQQFIADITSATGQSLASLLSACVDLHLNPCKGKALQAVLQHLSTTDASTFNFQAVANITYSLAKLPSAKPSPQLLDGLCNDLRHKIQSQPPHHRPDAQAISSFAWALQKLRHEPSPPVAAAMLGRMLELCRANRQQPTPQAISNLLLACADLRIAMTQHQADVLVAHLLAQQRPQTQDLANTAWSLAVSGCLQIGAFKLLLHRFMALFTYSSMLPEPQEAQLAQLYQAMDWLTPLFGASRQYQKAWSGLYTQLQLVGPRPQLDKGLVPVGNLPAALTELGLRHQLVEIQQYLRVAAVPPLDSIAKPILFNMESEGFSNHPARLTGRAIFCRQLLYREGYLITIPASVAPGSVQQLVEFLEPRLEAITEGRLDTYRLEQQSSWFNSEVDDDRI